MTSHSVSSYMCAKRRKYVSVRNGRQRRTEEGDERPRTISALYKDNNPRNPSLKKGLRGIVLYSSVKKCPLLWEFLDLGLQGFNQRVHRDTSSFGHHVDGGFR